jgi:ornithine carbamoyltransferase
MVSLLRHRNLRSLDDMTRRDVLAIVDTARALKRASHAGAASRPLRGKNLALLRDAGAQDGNDAFDRAATELGAHVAHLRPGDARIASDSDLAATARMLGRLYDGIECEHAALDMVEPLERHAGVPVFDGLSRPEHPAGALAELLTMAELAGKPLAELDLCVFDAGAASPRSRALLRAAELAGVRLHDGLDAAGADFALDAAGPVPRVRPLGAAASGYDQACDENRRFTLQAVLVSALV